nr:MAG TPA: hypothetical protein [Caudoviricetes sp.]
MEATNILLLFLKGITLGIKYCTFVDIEIIK